MGSYLKFLCLLAMGLKQKLLSSHYQEATFSL